MKAFDTDHFSVTDEALLLKLGSPIQLFLTRMLETYFI